MQNGNRAEWDCTMLLYSILFSDCVRGLNSMTRSNIDDPRKFGNEEFAHMPRSHPKQEVKEKEKEPQVKVKELLEKDEILLVEELQKTVL